MDNNVQDLLDKLLGMFSTGDLPPAIARTVIRRQENDLIPSDNWSIGNRILMFLQGTEDARGFQQWKQVERSVTKGSKAIYILAPITAKIIKQVTDPDTGEDQQTPIIIIKGFRTIPVFRVEDTHGKPLSNIDYSPVDLPPLTDVAEAYGISVAYKPFAGGCYGYYTWQGGKRIVLHTHDLKTWFHELGHALHSTFKDLKGGQIPEQEIVAEIFAAAMCELYGIQGYHQYSWEYIKSYADKEPNKALQFIMRILADVEECIKKVMAVAPIPELKQIS